MGEKPNANARRGSNKEATVETNARGSKQRSSVGSSSAPKEKKSPSSDHRAREMRQTEPMVLEESITPNDIENKKIAQQIFGHYAAIGDPLNRTTLSTLKFLRFLRDCGLVSSEVEGGPKDFQFAPGERMKRSGSSSRLEGGNRPEPPSVARSGSLTSLRRPSGSGLGRRGTTQSLQGPPSVNATGRSSQVFTVSPSKMNNKETNGTDNGLPLRIFPVPILNQVDADLIFVQATRVDGNSASSGANSLRRNSTSSVPAKRGSVTAKRHHMTFDAFVAALRDIALRCFPGEAFGAYECFCERFLGPLSDTLLEVKGQDVAASAEFMAEPETMKLLERCSPGLERIYFTYAEQIAGRKPCWTSESMARFADDFELSREVSSLPMQKIFHDCKVARMPQEAVTI